jgi:cyclophilin family peptidyl-prolyl cis-trans isomerase
VLVVIAVSAFLSSRSDNEVATGTTGPSTTASAASSTTPTTVASGPFQYGTGACPPAEGSPTPVLEFSAAPMQCIDPAKSYTATFETSAGTVKVSLDTVRTPGTANNFVVLSKYGYYNGTQLFRVAKSIDIVQGGAPHTNSSSDPGPGYTIPDEGGKFTYMPGQLVMARTPQPNSAGAQFFFSTGPKTANLDGQGTYVVFGTVTDGLDVVQKIVASAPDSQGDSAPNPPVTVSKVTITEDSTPPTSAPTPAAAGAAGGATPSSPVTPAG